MAFLNWATPILGLFSPTGKDRQLFVDTIVLTLTPGQTRSRTLKMSQRYNSNLAIELRMMLPIAKLDSFLTADIANVRRDKTRKLVASVRPDLSWYKWCNFPYNLYRSIRKDNKLSVAAAIPRITISDCNLQQSQNYCASCCKRRAAT